MSKKREYQVDDIVECTKLLPSEEDYFTVGKHYKIDSVSSMGDLHVTSDTGLSYCLLVTSQIKLVTAVEDRPKTLTKTEALHAMIDGEKVRGLDWCVNMWGYFSDFGFYTCDVLGEVRVFRPMEDYYEIYKEPELEKITIAGKDYEVTAEVLSEIMEKLK